MAKFQSPLLGFNNNVRHKGRMFHIQTEDSGVNHPHIITHLFMDGGRILKSVKTSYAEHLGNDKMSDTVRVMMKDQHKAMFVALREGQFDEAAFGAKTGSAPNNKAVVPPAPPTSVTTAEAATPPSDLLAAGQSAVITPPPSKHDIAADAPPLSATAKTELAIPAQLGLAPQPPAAGNPTVATAAETPVVTPAESNPITIDDRRALPRDDSSVEVMVAYSDEEILLEGSVDERTGIPSIDEAMFPRPPAAAKAPSSPEPFAPASLPIRPSNLPPAPKPDRRPSAQELTLDFDALERDVGAVSPMFAAPDLPPPPKNLFATGRREVGTGSYRTLERESRHEDVPPTNPPPRAPAPKPSIAPAPTTVKAPTAGENRFAPARPAATFAPSSSTKPASPPSSLFGDDLVSDKSLDEVILSYLAEDLDPPRRK